MVKRILRSAWVLALDGFIVWLLYELFFHPVYPPEAVAPQIPHRWPKFLLVAALPILGIVFEFAGLKLARWVNIGYLVLAACFLLAEALWRLSGTDLGLAVFTSLVPLVIAGITEIIYRMTEDDLSYTG
jgi:hypothetical protein